jgi:hypothetical protein
MKEVRLQHDASAGTDLEMVPGVSGFTPAPTISTSTDTA